MKIRYYSSLFFLILIAVSVVCCSGDKNNIKSQIDNQNENKSSEVGADNLQDTLFFGESAYAKTIDKEAVKAAHLILLEYPGAILDQTKGSYSQTDMGETYNLVYHTDDSVKKVVDFYKKNIAESYLKLVSPPENHDWVQLEYSVEKVGHSADLLVWKTKEGSTEIVYMIRRTPKV